MIILPECYREAVRRWMVGLFAWREGPSYLGKDCWQGNVVYKCSQARLELCPVFTEAHVVFAIMRDDRMLAALKMDRDERDKEFLEELCAAATNGDLL